MHGGEPDGFDYQGHLIRPPSEAYSILIQFTTGCSHNKCTFCAAYKTKRFSIKPEETLLRDLAFARRYCRRQDKLFLMDGDALIVPQKKLTWLLDEIRSQLPWVQRVGAYANHKSIKMKSDRDLSELRDKGLGILYYGVESGDDETLRRIRKGTNAENLTLQGRRAVEAGFDVSATVLLGIAGRERGLEHARATGEVLSRIDPRYVGALTTMVVPGTALADEQASGEWTLPEPLEMLAELREMVRTTRLSDGLFSSNHASNYLPLRIRYPEGQADALRVIDAALEGQIGLKPEWLRAL
ncbi:MAG: radical SAM protein [Proteobacteria bacterium]|nr:radical SAM protein [Pseudomonadota bacterium]